MILLDGHSLTPVRKVPLEAASLTLKERDATATITPADMDGIGVGVWLQDDTEPGAGIVWRVKSISTAYATDTVTVELEHMINVLKDIIIFGEIKPKDITGNAGATTCTAWQAANYVIARSQDWVLQRFDGSDEQGNEYKFDGDTLYDALETITNSVSDSWWTYDMSVWPFKLSIIHKPYDVTTEMRAGRNIKTITRSIDRAGMYTRFYPIGKDDLNLPEQYVEKNAQTYGVVCKVETDQSIDSETELRRWANERLNAHAEPAVSIDIEGVELAAATGEPLDRILLGNYCRVPLPEFGTTILERVVQLSIPDKIRAPEHVKVTLANTKTDVTSIIAENIKSGGGGGKSARTAAKDQKADHAWFEDTDEHVAMVAEGIIGTDPETGEPYWGRLSEFIVDGEGLHAKVTTELNGVTDRVASLEINESEIRSDVAASQSQIYTTIEQTATGIRTELVNAQSGLYAYVDQTASYWRQTYISNTSKNWVQDTDPTTGGATPKDGDIWIESTFNGTWDGAEGFNWDHEEGYDWTQLQGAKVWIWANDHWELASDQQQVVSATDVEETAEHVLQRAIRMMVNDDGNLSVYRAELEVKGDQILSHVNELISDMGSTIEQTASYIRAEVHAAESQLYSVILQTASQITIRVGESNMVFTGMTEPVGTSDHPLVDGDLWLEGTGQRTWDDMEQIDAWIDDEDYDWSDLKGSTLHVYDAEAGEFKLAMDETALATDTDFEETSDHISQIARSVKQVDGKIDVFRAEVKVQSDAVTSTLTQRIANVGSNITQTASQIRSEVHAANSRVYSFIEQTASYIRTQVADNINGLSSQITQTASQIRAEVNAANSTIYSTITQTASQIRLEVSNTASGLSSRITQNANGIELKVSKNGVVSAINQTAESVKISAGKVNLDGYVTTSMMSSAFQDIQQATIGQLTISSYCTFLGSNATWQETTIPVLSYSGQNYFVYHTSAGDYNMAGYILRSHSTKTIYYVGYPS